MSCTVAFAAATAINVGGRDRTLRIAGIRRHAPSTHNDQESNGGTSTPNRQIACVMQVPRMTEKEAERGMNTLELKIGEKIKVLKGACREAEIKDNLPVMSGKTWKFCEIADTTE